MKPGYKQTEVGVIPVDWDEQRLGSTSSITTGRKDVNEGNPYGEYPFFTCSRYHTYSDFYSFDTEAILIAGNGDVGNLHRYCGKFEAYQRTYVVHKFSSHVPYVWHQLRYRLAESLGLGKIGSSIPYIKKGNLTGFSFPIPPSVAEQEAIAEALGDADALIESLERLIAKKRDIKQGAMQELLTGQKRLPGFTGKWEVKRLGDCLLSPPDYGINAPSVPYSGNLPNYIRITDISEHGRFCPNPPVSVKAANAEHYYLHEGDVVFARTGASVGKSYLYDLQDGQLVFAGFLIRVRVNTQNLVPAFLAGYAMTKAYWDWVRLMSMRSGQPGINGYEYAQLPLTLPHVSEQTAIAAVLSDMDAEIAALEGKLSKARAIKQGMMQELLTGRIRLV